MTKRIVFLYGSVFFLVLSCNNESSKESVEEVVSEDTVQAIVEAESHSYALPSPLQIASIFRNSGIGYLEGITNQQKDVSKYTSNVSKAANLGIYTADLAYCVLNQQTQEALNYIKLSKQLAGILGMGSIFEASAVYGRFEKNLGTKDSLISILADLQMETDAYLDEAQQQSTSLIIYAGAWIEGMYIGAKYFDIKKTPDLSNKIIEQMTVLRNLLKMFEANNSQDPAFIDLGNDLNAIKKLYDSFDSVKKYNAATEESLDDPLLMSTSEVASLSKEISTVRSKIVM